MRSLTRGHRYRLLLALVVGFSPPLGAQERNAPVWDLVELRADAAAIAELAPRLEGSRNERDTLRYVRERAESLGAVVRVVSYADSETVHSFSSGLEVSVDGARTDTLLVVVPVDQRVRAPPGSDGSAAIALALQLLRELSVYRPPLTVRLLFLGAEHGEGAEYPIGSRRYLDGFHPPGRAAVLYLNLESLPARLTLRGGTDGIVAPFWLVRTVTGSLSRARLPYRFRGNENQIDRMGLTGKSGFVAPFLQAGYPSLSLEAPERIGSPRELTGAWLDEFAAFMGGLLESLGAGIPDQWDRHYLSFQVAGRIVAIPELTYILLLAALVAGCLLLGILSGHQTRRYAIAFLRGSWSIPFHLGFLYLFALVPTLLIELLLSVLDFPTLWQLAPLQLLLLKALLGFALLSLLTPLLTRTVLPRGDTFYAATSIVLLSFVLVGAALRDVSLAVYLAWALVFFLASARSRNRTAKILFYLVSPLLLVRALVELIALGELGLARWVLLDRFAGSAFAVAAVAPFYFMGLRLRLLFRAHRGPRRRLLIAILGLAALAGASATAAWIGYTRPYRGGASRPLTARAVLDYDQLSAGLEIDCPISIGEFSVTTPAGTTRTVTRARHAAAVLDTVPLPLEVSATGDAFLDRRNVLITFSAAPGSSLWPYRFELRLVGDGAFVLFDASFPFVRDPSGREYTIRVGASPPSPLLLELTLSQDVGYELHIRAEYLEFPPALVVSSPGAVVEPHMEILTTYRFRS